MVLVSWFLLVVLAVFTGCTTIQKSWDATKEEDTISAYEKFLAKFPEGEFTDEACRKLVFLKFQEAKSTNTAQAYEQFLKKFPEGEFADKAREELAVIKTFQDVMTEGTGVAFERFLAEYPEGGFADSVRSRLALFLRARSAKFDSSVKTPDWPNWTSRNMQFP